MKIFLEKQKRACDESIFEIIMKEKKGNNLSEVALEVKRERKRRNLVLTGKFFYFAEIKYIAIAS
ncbi:hypothetical protein H7U05_15970 [Priestia megaterium]|nr:hypothetical protein [Priestia megaterium]